MQIALESGEWKKKKILHTNNIRLLKFNNFPKSIQWEGIPRWQNDISILKYNPHGRDISKWH